MGEHRDAALADQDAPADLHGGRWLAARDRAAELIELQFTKKAAGWGWSSWHLGRDVVAISVFVLAHRWRCQAKEVAAADVAGLLGEAARPHSTLAQVEAMGQRSPRRPAYMTDSFESDAYLAYRRAVEQWHTARTAQTDTLRKRLMASLADAGVDLLGTGDLLANVWRWLDRDPAPPFGEDNFPPVITQNYLREGAEYAMRLLGLEMRELTGGTAVSDLRLEGWWRGRTEHDESGRAYVSEAPSLPGGPSRLGVGNYLTLRVVHDGTCNMPAEHDSSDILVINHDGAGDVVPSLTNALGSWPRARMVLAEDQPGFWAGLWRPHPDRPTHQRLEITTKVPFAPEVIGTALLGWQDWKWGRADQTGQSPLDWFAASTLQIRVPALAEWMPLIITPIDAAPVVPLRTQKIELQSG